MKNFIRISVFFLLSSYSFSATYTWNNDIASANWNVNSNWLPATGYPNAESDIANFPSLVEIPSISLTSNITIGQMIFQSANTYFFNSNVFIMDNGASNAVIQSISSSTQNIAVPLSLLCDLDISQNGASAFINLTGDISGANKITIQAGNVYMSGNNTYAGGTEIIAGATLTGHAASIQGDVLGGGTLSPESGTCAASISGSVDLDISSGVSIVLTGTNTYTGGTSLTNATVTGDTSSITGDYSFSSNSNLIFDQSSDGTYSGSITGAGGLEKKGTGSVTLTGTNTYTGSTTVTAGTLTVNTDSIPGNLVDNASLIFNQTSDNTFSGDISGSGSMTKQGAGILTLQGTSTFSGTTTITAGTLIVDTDSISGNITDNASLIFNQTSDNTFSGDISGSGSMTKQGAGILTLQGTNTFTGTTTITTGGIRGSSTAISGDIVNNVSSPGGLIFNQGSDGTFSDNISGTGDLEKTGAAILTLTGTNTYTGATTITAGTLQGATTVFPGNITDNATLSFDQTTDTTYSDIISGTGSLRKKGTGSVRLANDNTYTGTTTIEEGKLSVDGSITSDVTISSGASLGGTGTITGDVDCYGNIKPGESVGTTTVYGDVTFESGSLFSVEITPSAADLLDVKEGDPGTGNVTINSGATLEILPDMGCCYSSSATYTVIRTEGNITGTFSSISSPYPSFIGEINYLSNELQLIVNIVPFSQIVQGGNPGAVASYLDGIGPFPEGSDLDNIIEALQFLQADEMREALDQLHPSIFKGFILSQEANAISATKLLSERSKEVYKTTCTRHIKNKKKINFWISPFSDFYRQNNYHREYDVLYGFSTNSISTFSGVDFKVSKRGYIGTSLGYSYSHINWKHERGKGDVHSYYMGIYGFLYNEYLFMNTSIIGAINRYHGKRYINISDIKRTAKNNHGGRELISHVDTGLILDLEDIFELRPFFSLDFLYLHENSFKEKGAQSLNLEVKSKDYIMWRIETGANLATCAIFKGRKIIPDFKLSFVREMRRLGKHSKSLLIGHPGYLITEGINKDRSLISPGASLSAMFARDRGIFNVRYDSEYGKKYQNHIVTLQVTYGF